MHESDLVLTISANQGLVPQSEYFTKKVSGTDTSGYYLLKKGDFAYNRSYSSNYPYGAIKRLDADSSGIVSTLYIVFEPKNNIISDYLAIYFETNKWHKEIANISGEGARNHGLLNVSPIDFFNTMHYVPSTKEQRKIADFIELILFLESTISNEFITLKKYKEGLTKIYLTETIDNWKGKENRGIKLKEFLIETKEYSENDGTLPHLTLSKEGVEPKTDRYDRDFLVNDKMKKYKITKINQLCYNPANLKFGVICINHFGSGIFSPIYVTFQIQKIHINYLEMILTSKDFVNYSLRYQEGTVYERMAVSVDNFVNIQIVPCSEEDQKLISNVLKSLQKIIKVENQKLNILDSIKNYFLNNMFI